MLRFLLSLLICALLSPASVSAADLQQPTPISAAGTEPPISDTVPSPLPQDLELDLTPLLAAQEAAAQELAGLHDFLMEIWQHVRFWAVAALAYWFAKKSWQGVT